MWVRGIVDLKQGSIRVEYQPQIKGDSSGLTVYDLDGNILERLVYGQAMSDISNEPWRVACQLHLYAVEGLDVFKVGKRMRALECILETTMMLILLGYGESAQEVLGWFQDPFYGRWVISEIPYLVRVGEMGSSRLEVKNATCSIEGLVTFTVDILGEEVDLSMPWDRFLLHSKIDVKEDIYESI